IAVSSDGGDSCYPGYDLVGACKAVLETLCRYLAVRLKHHGVCVNAIRPGVVDTMSLRSTFGDDRVSDAKRLHPELFLDPDRVAQVCVGLCSGWFDGVTGQVITVDEGQSLRNPLALVFQESDRVGWQKDGSRP